MAKIKSINLNAGHNASGKVACGACGFLDESKENRKVAKYVKKYLKAGNVKVNDCTVDNASSQSSNLSRIVKKCDANNVDLNVFIHFNCGVNDKTGNGKTTGTEVLVYTNTGIKKTAAVAVRKKIAALGFKDRGTKINQNLYVLHRSKAPSILVECCFVDDKDDAKLYNARKMGKAIAGALLSLNI